MKECSKCGIEKPRTEFHKRKRRGKTDGLYKHCKDCHRELVRLRRANIDPRIPESKQCRACGQVKESARFFKNNGSRDGLQSRCRECSYMTNRLQKYGLTAEQYQAMVAEAAGLCRCCEKPRPLIIDHCHESGRVRGLICTPCNLILGHAGDDPDVLRACMAYLAA